MKNIDVIQQQVDQIKTDLDFLKKEANDFKSQKEKISAEEKKQKEILINQKKESIEIKKKEIEKMLIDIKLEQLDQAQLQKVVATEEEMHKINLELEGLKQKNWLTRQRDGLSDSTEEHHILKNTARIVGGAAAAYLAYRGIKKLFGRGKKKEKKEGEGDKDVSSKEKKPGYKRRWGIAGIGAGGILAWKNRDKIKGWFGGMFGEKITKEGDGKTESIEDSGKEFKEKLSDEEKKYYNNFADQVNAFYLSGSGEFSDELQKDKLGSASFEKVGEEKIQGMVPFMLNNRYTKEGGIDALLSESSFYKEVALTDNEDGVIQTLKSWSADQIGKFLAPIAGSIDGMLPAFVKFKASKQKDDLIERIKGKPEARAAIRLAFRKSIMIISYLNNKENNLKYLIAKEVIAKQDSIFNQKTAEDQNEMILEKLKDEKFYADYVDGTIKSFRSKSLYEGIKFLEEKKCLDEKIDAITQDAIDDVEKRKNKLLDKDDEGSTKIDEIKSHIEGGKISPEGKKELEELLSDFDEEIDDVGSKHWYNKYIPLMNFFDPSDQIMEKILKSGDYDATVKIFREKISSCREKITKGTITSTDIDELKKTIDEYFVFQKSLAMSQTNIEEVVDKNGNRKYRWWNTIIVSGETLWHGGELVVEGKYFQGGAMVAGSLVSLDILTYPIRLVAVGVSKQKFASSPSLKAVYKLGKFTIKKGAQLTGKSLNIAMRNYMPSKIAAAMYKDKDYIFRLELAKGNMSLEKAVKIATRNGIRARISGNVIATEDELIQRVAGIGNSESDIKNCNLIKKYWNNKNIMKQIINAEYKGKWYTIVEKAGKYNYNINPGTIEQLSKIDTFLGNCTHAGKASLVNGYLETTKTLKPELLQELFATSTFDALSVEESKYIGRLLGKKMHTFASVDDFKAFQGFFARNYANYPTNTFIKNSLSKRGKLKTLDEVAQAKYIESAGLNVSRYEKLANNVKGGVNSMIKDLKAMLKNPKMKTFYVGLQSKINSLTEYVQTVTPQSIRATQEASWLDKITGFGKLSDEGIAAMKSLNTLINTDKNLLTLVSKANTLDEVKGILRQSGVAVEHIDDSILMKIVQTKNIDKIKSIVNYGAEIKSINTLKKIFTNPSMKVFAKWLGVVGAIADFAFVGMDFVADMKEAERIQQYNIARGKNKEAEAYFDVVVGSTGAVAGLVGAIAIFGTANSWNPVGRVCLAGVGITVGVEALGDLYYGEIDKFKQNYKDFVSQSMPEIKQRLIYINSWQNELEHSFQDFWSKITGNMGAEEKKNLSPKTSADAVKALIYLEELQKYPYASADLNASEVRNNPTLKIHVEEQKNLHEKTVETRYAYIKKNYIDGKSSIVSKDIIEKNQGIAALDAILAESRMCQAVENDAAYTNKTDVKGYQKYLESDLKKSNAEGFAKLEQMYVINNIQFFQTIASLPYYENLLQGTEVEDKEKLLANLAFFKKYVNYKLANVSLSDYPSVSIDKDTIDYDGITRLLTSWKMTVTGLSATEIATKHIEYLTDVQIIEKYKVSPNLGQNILYEIANKKLGYTGKNTLDELKKFYNEEDKAIKGIYFDPSDKDWAINENNGSDNEFATDAELNSKENIIKMRGYIYDAAESSTTGNMIAGNDTANKEYAKNYVDIINQNLDFRINPATYYTYIANYIKTNAHDVYIQLPPEILIIGIKAGIPQVGAFVYRRNGKSIEAKSGINGINSVFVPSK